MKVIVEGHSIEIDIEDKNVPLKQVIAEVEQLLLERGRVPNALSINGREITQEELEKRLEERIDAKTTLEFGSCDFYELVAEQMESCPAANAILIQLVETATKETNNEKAREYWNQLTQGLKDFFEYWERILQFDGNPLSRVMVKGGTLDQVILKLFALCKESVAALEYQDIVLAGDILRYELIPGIRQIDEALPQVKAELMKMTQKRKS